MNGTQRNLSVLSLAAVATAWLAAAPGARGEFILETATLGSVGQNSGYAVSLSQILGARFSIAQPYAISAIGGHLVSNGETFYGAIVELTGPAALPQGAPFTGSEVVASIVTSYDGLSQDVVIPVSLTLLAGDYALVFGDGAFGAGFSSTSLPGNNTDLPGASRFYWDGIFTGTWVDDAVRGGRFFVIGEPVPEPGVLLLAASGLATLCLARWRQPRL